MQGILAYRGQVTQALPGQTNRLVANIGDKQALGGYVKVNEWNDYEIIARGGVMMHIMNGQLMAVFIDDNKDSVNNQPGSHRLRDRKPAVQDLGARYLAAQVRLGQFRSCHSDLITACSADEHRRRFSVLFPQT